VKTDKQLADVVALRLARNKKILSESERKAKNYFRKVLWSVLESEGFPEDLLRERASSVAQILSARSARVKRSKSAKKRLTPTKTKKKPQGPLKQVGLNGEIDYRLPRRWSRRMGRRLKF